MKILLYRPKTNDVVLTNVSLNESKTKTALNRTFEINTGSLLFTHTQHLLCCARIHRWQTRYERQLNSHLESL